jgi:hypothetical protein
MRLAAPILAAVLALASPALADPANVALAQSGTDGAAGRIVLAQQTYQAAMQNGDTILLLAAIRLARSVTVRPPTSWTKATEGEPTADPVVGRAAAPDPASPQVLAIAQALAGEDYSLQDIVYDLDAQRPHGRLPTAIKAMSDLGAGQTDSWRIALSGDVAAELGLIGDGDTALDLTVTDETGSVVCALPPGVTPALCRFTPARNGFFSVKVRNHGEAQNSYQLIGS